MRACVALALLPHLAQGGEAEGLPEGLEVLLTQRLRRQPWKEHDLVWHDTKMLPVDHCDGVQAGVWHPDEDEDGQAQACLLATCSIECSARNQQTLSTELASMLQLDLSADVHKVDILAHAPCRVPLLKEKLADVTVDPRLAGRSPTTTLLQSTGLVVLQHGALSETLLPKLRKVASDRIAQCDHALELRGVNVGTELFRFAEVSARGKHRFDLLFDLGLPESAPLLEAARSAAWASLVEAVLGPKATIECSVVYSRPGAQEQEWHSDGPHTGTTANWIGEGESGAYALCVFAPLIDLSYQVGFTQFWLGSHKYKELIGFGGIAPVLSSTTDAIVNAGGAVVYDYRLMHRGMPNHSPETERPVLQFLYHHPNYKEKENYGDEQLFTEAFVCKSVVLRE